MQGKGGPRPPLLRRVYIAPAPARQAAFPGRMSTGHGPFAVCCLRGETGSPARDRKEPASGRRLRPEAGDSDGLREIAAMSSTEPTLRPTGIVPVATGVPAEPGPTGLEPVVARLREARPLVMCMTNLVVMPVSANVLLAAGASPAMILAPEEAEDFAGLSDALLVNLGTIPTDWVSAMTLAVHRVNADRRPWVLDPVGCGATPHRSRVARQLAERGPAIIRGNASEIIALSGTARARPKGVDSADGSEDAIEAARVLARDTGAVVAVTGATDYVTDGQRVAAITGGHPFMTLSTGIGCALSGYVAACAAVAPPFAAAVGALAAYGAAGARAAAPLPGPGNLPAALCDALYALDDAEVATRAGVRLL